MFLDRHTTDAALGENFVTPLAQLHVKPSSDRTVAIFQAPASMAHDVVQVLDHTGAKTIGISEGGYLQARASIINIDASATVTIPNIRASGCIQRTNASAAQIIIEPTLAIDNDGLHFTTQLRNATSGDITISSGSTFWLDGTDSGTSIVNTSHAAGDKVVCMPDLRGGFDYVYACKVLEGTWN